MVQDLEKAKVEGGVKFAEIQSQKGLEAQLALAQIRERKEKKYNQP